jgi:hypothetical protein
MAIPERDQDSGKGATEEADQHGPGNQPMQGQLGHRDQDPLLKDADTDFPEPGGSPEHTGEPAPPHGGTGLRRGPTRR